MFKKSQKNRAFFAAIAMLLLSAIVITTASFAWFSLGRSAMASNLDLKVTKQGEGIQISANATSFTDTLTFEDLNGTSTTGFQAVSEDYNFFPAMIEPASSSFALNALPAFFTGGVDKATNTLESLATTSDNGVDVYGKSDAETPAGSKQAGYYVFDVFVDYSGGETAQLKIGQSDITVKNDESDGTQAIAEAANAMRIGFVNCGTVTKGANPAQATSGSEAVIFATNEDARNTQPIASTGMSAEIAEDAYTVPKSSAGDITIADNYNCAVDTGAEDQVINITSGVNRIRVYIWMEGQDANCTDSLQSQLVSANLVFTLV
ncbi:MAG: hypothetical protein U0K91_02825 [Acutalibacteraceae bacterium]|nr:hypothetical protein [Acutalibacteraceae bacterium]